MPTRAIDDLDNAGNCDFVHGLMERCLARGALEVPLLPEVALRVVRSAESGEINAKLLAEIVSADSALAMVVLRVAGSAGRGSGSPVGSVQQAVAWLGFDEVANIAFTLALQATILDVPGHHTLARRLWRHALASALWSKHLARLLRRDGGASYLCGLLHNVGKPVTLGAVHKLSRRAQARLSREEYERLIETFHHPVGIQVVGAWNMRAGVQAAAAHWMAYAGAGDARFECNIVNVAHALADCTLESSTQLARELMPAERAFRDLGLGTEDVVALFDAADSIRAELDRFLAP
jgi:HD-like signal output (HDOD) protein